MTVLSIFLFISNFLLKNILIKKKLFSDRPTLFFWDHSLPETHTFFYLALSIPSRSHDRIKPPTFVAKSYGLWNAFPLIFVGLGIDVHWFLSKMFEFDYKLLHVWGN